MVTQEHLSHLSKVSASLWLEDVISFFCFHQGHELKETLSKRYALDQGVSELFSAKAR